MARLAALEAFVQWAYRVWVIHGSRTCKGALPANRGASAAAPPRGICGRPTPSVPCGTARSWSRSALAHCWCALPRRRKPLPCTRCRSCQRQRRKPRLRNRRWRGVCVGGGLALMALPRPPWPEGENSPVGELREPALAPHRFQLLELGVGRADGSDLLRRRRLS